LTLPGTPVYRDTMNTYNPTPRSLRRPVAPVLAFLLFGVLAQACATGGSAAAPAAPTGPAELDGSKWKLVALAGSLDGRVIQFKKRGSNGYEGKLVSLGRRLQDVVGLQEGFVMFQLKRKSDNEFEGVYKAIDPKGGQQDKEVVMFVNGSSMTWNQESAVWERQD
jgi:uncharacterized protein (DUF2147 family)